MKNSEHLLEKVLSGLQNAEPSPGMEHRILMELRDRASNPAPPLRHRLGLPWSASHARGFAISAACLFASLLAIALLTPAIHHFRNASTPPARNFTSLQHAPAPIIPRKVPTQATATTVHKTTTHHPRKASPPHPDDSLAGIEMRAPSLPAPPMPLTNQERLLLRIVHARDPVELASLDRTAWAAQLAKDKAQFDEFFETPKTDPTGDKQ